MEIEHENENIRKSGKSFYCVDGFPGFSICSQQGNLLTTSVTNSTVMKTKIENSKILLGLKTVFMEMWLSEDGKCDNKIIFKCYNSAFSSNSYGVSQKEEGA